MNKFLDILPIVIMIESFIASIPLFYAHRWGSGMYWFAAGCLNFGVIFLIRRFG